MDAAVDSSDAAAADARADHPDGAGGVSLEAYCAQATDLWCRWLDRCAEGCDAHAATGERAWCQAATSAVAAERLGFDPIRAAQCLDRLSAATMDCANDGPLAGCSPFVGQVPRGGRCYPSHLFDEDECVAGAVCAGAADYAGFCPGRCTVGGRLGDLCDAIPCAEGFRCVDAICLPLGELGDECAMEPCRPELRCQPLGGVMRCVAVREVGEVCGPEPSRRCVTGAACVEGRCVDSAPLGAACWDSAQCGPSDWCDPLAGVCAPRPELGEPCGGPCQDGECVADASSPTGRRCLQPAEEGQRCDPAPCRTGLRCREGRCAPPSTDTCAAPTDCAEGLWCDGSTCREPSTEGGPCGLCVPGLYCRAGLCAPVLPSGSPCSSDASCGPGADCADLDGAGPRCRAHAICNGP